MKKSKRILLLSLGILSSLSLAMPLIATSCKDPKNPTPEPTPKPNIEIDQEKIDKWVKEEIQDIFKVIKDKELEFQKAIRYEKDFYYDFKTKKVVAVEKNKRPDWKSQNLEYLLELRDSNLPRNYQFANVDKPLYESGGTKKISSILSWKIVDEQIIFSYRGVIHNKNGNHIVSTNVATSNLGKYDGQNIEKYDALLKAQKQITFTYPNIADTYLNDAEESKIEKNIPAGYKLSHFKAIKNYDLDLGIYEYTIIFKLTSEADPTIESKKNVEFAIKGFKKTQEILDKEHEAIAKIDNEFSKSIVKLLNEKAYQDVIKHKHINNYDGKPNFIASGYDESLYNPTFSDLKLVQNGTKYDIKLTLTLTSKTNSDIHAKREMNVSGEYAQGINPHLLTDQEQKKYLEDALLNTIVYPYYSKDKTYIQNLKYSELTNKSYFISKKDNNLDYEYTDLIKKNDKYYIKTFVKFANWSQSPKFEKEIEIDLNKLGLEIINEARVKKGLEPLQDQYAPTPTLPEYDEPDVKLEKFQDTANDETAGSTTNKMFLDEIKKNKLWAYDVSLLNTIQNGTNKKYIQRFLLKKEENDWKLKTQMYFATKGTKIFADQQVYYFSNFKKENGELTVKVTTVTYQEYSANKFDEAASTRVVIDTTKIAEEYVAKKCFSDYLKNKEIPKNIKMTYKNASETLPKDATIENIEYFNLPSEFTLTLVEVDKTYNVPGSIKVWYTIFRGKQKSFTFLKIIKGFKKN